MFALVSWLENPLHLNLKCDPDDAIAYRDIYESITPGYHMNKKHWNTISIDGGVPDEVLVMMFEPMDTINTGNINSDITIKKIQKL